MDSFAAYEQNLAVRKLEKEANQRLQERIIGFNLLREGEAGADKYLQKFGRGISAAKCAALDVACIAYAEKNEALCGLSVEETRRCLQDFARKFKQQVELLGGLQ